MMVERPPTSMGRCRNQDAPFLFETGNLVVSWRWQKHHCPTPLHQKPHSICRQQEGDVPTVFGQGQDAENMGKLFEKITHKDHILASYQLVKEKWFDPSLELYKYGAPGIDGLDLTEFDRQLEEQLAHCQEFFLNPDREFYPQILSLVPKDEPGKFREIYLLSLRDKVIHKAMADPLATMLDRHFYPNLFSYRKGKYYGTIAAARKVRILLEKNPGKVHVFKADISDYFDSIHQGLLLEKFRNYLPEEPELMRWLEKFVHQRRCEKGIVYSPIVGIPTGSGLSPVCANLYLTELDRQMFRKGYHYLRYGDDVLLLATDKGVLQEGRSLMEDILTQHHLSLSEKKTLVCEPGQPFDYLGYRFEGGKIHIGSISMKRFHDWVYELLPRDRYRDHPNQSVEDRRALLKKILLDFNTGMAASLNLRQLPWIRGFPIVDDDSSFKEMDRFIKNRIRLVITRKASRRNFEWVPEAWFRELGFKSLTGAYYRIIRRRSLHPYRGWRRYFGTNFEAFLEHYEEKSSLGKRWERLKYKIKFVRKALNGEWESPAMPGTKK
jgi:retron-type reverse transcriptase